MQQVAEQIPRVAIIQNQRDTIATAQRRNKHKLTKNHHLADMTENLLDTEAINSHRTVRDFIQVIPHVKKMPTMWFP